MDIAIWLNLPDWLLAGECTMTEHAIWLGHNMVVSVKLLWY